jgi:hypothetical protein
MFWGIAPQGEKIYNKFSDFVCDERTNLQQYNSFVHAYFFIHCKLHIQMCTIISVTFVPCFYPRIVLT